MSYSAPECSTVTQSKWFMTKVMIALLVFPTLFSVYRLILEIPIYLILSRFANTASTTFIVANILIMLCALVASFSTCRLVWPKGTPKAKTDAPSALDTPKNENLN